MVFEVVFLKRKAFSFLALLLAFLFAPVHLVQQGWAKYGLSEVYAQVLTSLEEALETFFSQGEAVTVETQILTIDQLERVAGSARLGLSPQQDAQYRFYVGRKDGEITGYAAVDAVPGKWGMISYAILLSPEGKVKDVLVMEYREKRGRPVAKKRFLKQFRGKDKDDAIRLMKDIRGVTGASMSSNGMANGVRKMVHVFAVLYGEGSEIYEPTNGA